MRRAAEALGAIRKSYVDELPPAPLAARCTGGMESWLAERKLPLAPAEKLPAEPLDRIGELILRASAQHANLEVEKLVDACIRPMIDGLDRLSSYLDREAFRDLQGAAPMGGIGLELGRQGDYTVIVSVIDGAPASRSDLRQGDLILAVDGASTKGLSLAEVVRLMRGKPGSTIALELRRQGAGAAEQTVRRELTRAIIRVQSVRATPLEGRVLHLRISQFQERTREDFVNALHEAQGRDPAGIAGIVLDLRNNTGGLLYSCVGIAAAFLPESAVVVAMKGRTPDNDRQLLARREDYERGGRDASLKAPPEAVRKTPLVVLVNRRSASCAEILASALQDHGRAKVIGEKTFGAGTIQTILALGGSSALRLTTARFYRASGAAIEANPVTPDLTVDFGDGPIAYGSETDPGLAPARRLLEAR